LPSRHRAASPRWQRALRPVSRSRAATDELDFLRLGVLDALLVLQADSTPVPAAKLLSLVGDRAAHADVADALTDLRHRALVWGEAAIRVAADAGAALPWHPGQVSLEDSSRTGDQIAELIARLDQPQRDVLEKLLEGSPMGRTRDAAPGAAPDRPVPQLLAMGLLRRIDAETVILPRHVGQVLRGEDPGPMQLTAPDPVVSTTTPDDADAAAAGAVIDLLREIDVLLENPWRRTGCRAAQRRAGSSRNQTAGQNDRHRRASTGSDPRDRGRGRPDRQRHARPGTLAQ